MRRAYNLRCATAGPAGTTRDGCCSRRRREQSAVEARATVLALGGASWPRLGSDGGWVETLAAKGVKVSPLKPANCGFKVAWSDIFRDRFEGQPLKGIALSFGGRSVRGEAVITRDGIEGGAVYALSAELREAVLASGRATLHIALRPDLRPMRSHHASVVAARKTDIFELAAQGGAIVAGGDRPVAGSRHRVRRRRWRRCRRKHLPH